MSRVKTDDGRQFIECDHCGILEDIDRIKHHWYEVDVAEHATWGGGPIRLGLSACSWAHLRLLLKTPPERVDD